MPPPIGDVTSSVYRLARVATLASGGRPAGPLETAADIVAVLADQGAVNGYAIRRQNSRNDPYVTLCTALFDLRRGTDSVWTGDPGAPDSSTPDLVVELR